MTSDLFDRVGYTSAGRDGDRINVLGVGVSPVHMDSALGRIDGWIQRRERHWLRSYEL